MDELTQFIFIRKFSEQQQISRFLKVELSVLVSLDQFADKGLCGAAVKGFP